MMPFDEKNRSGIYSVKWFLWWYSLDVWHNNPASRRVSEFTNPIAKLVEVENTYLQYCTYSGNSSRKISSQVGRIRSAHSVYITSETSEINPGSENYKTDHVETNLCFKRTTFHWKRPYYQKKCVFERTYFWIIFFFGHCLKHQNILFSYLLARLRIRKLYHNLWWLTHK